MELVDLLRILGLCVLGLALAGVLWWWRSLRRRVLATSVGYQKLLEINSRHSFDDSIKQETQFTKIFPSKRAFDRADVRRVAKERINQEFSKLVLGEYADEVINAYYKVLKICAPGIVRTALKGLPESLPVRLAVLFPRDTVQALRNLKFDRVTINMASAVSRLLERRNKPSVERGEMLRLLREAGREVTELYYAAADQRRPDSVQVFPFLEELLAENPCYLIEHLAISGKDLIEMGMKSGPAVGDALDNVLDLIIEGSLKNDRDELLRHIANTECKNEKGWKEQKNELQCKTNLGH